MAFPQTPLPIAHLIAPGADPAKPSTYQFTDVTADVRYASGIQITAGRQDEHSTASTTGHTLTLDNRAGNYSPRNPLGTWYGQLRKGTPSQTRVKLIDDLFARTVASGLGTDATTGYAWSAGSSWSVNGTNGLVTLATANAVSVATLPTVCSDDIDILKITSCSAVATGAAWVDATAIRYQDSSNFYRVHTEYAVGGTISVKVARTVAGAPTDILPITSTAVAYSAGTKIRTRVQAIGPTIRIKVWLDGSAEPAAWTASVDDNSTVVRGNCVGLYQWRVAGNTNAGSMSVSVYEFRCDTIRATTPVPEWPTRWNQTGSNVTSPVVGAGVMRRLSQGQSALRSPLYRQISGYSTLTGYWPCEDASGATQITNVVAGRPAGRVNSIELGATGPAGSAGAATFTNADASSNMTGVFANASTTAGWQVSWCMKLAATPPAGGKQIMVWTTSTGYIWTVAVDSGVYSIIVQDNNLTSVVNVNVSNVGFGDPTQWIAFRMKATASGGTVTAQFAWYVQGAPTVFGDTETFTGTVGALRFWSATGNSDTQNGSICHIFGVTTGNDDLQSYAQLRAFDGYAGETAGNRLIRLAASQGVPMIVMGDPAKTALMGAQGPDTFINLARECEDADQGVLIERGAGLGFLTREFRYNVPVAMALDFSAGQIASPPEPTDDDLNLLNVISLTRKNGSQITVQNSTSVGLSGAYTDERTVNLQLDSQLSDQAGWRLHMGTIDELRWPIITLQLHSTAGTALIPAWCGMRIGSRITIANPPTPGDSLDLIVEGYTETINQFSWDVTLNCSPASPWAVGVYNASTSRYDSANTTLASGMTSGAASASLKTAFSDPPDWWSTTGTPYNVRIGGEVMTVTAMTSPVGTGPWTQTATVTRAVNGVVLAHNTNDPVVLAAPVRYAL